MIFSLALIVLSLLSFTSYSLARPNLTEEELAQARKAGAEAKYPINFDALMDEADRLGVECEGDLTTWVKQRICSIRVESAQFRESTEASKKRQAEIQKETARLIHEAADKAERKLKQMKEQ